MKRTDPNFKDVTVTELENLEFLNEMFAELFDSGEVHSNMDEVPNWSKQLARFGKPHP